MSGGEQNCSFWSKDKPWWSVYKINDIKFKLGKNGLKIQGKPWWSFKFERLNWSENKKSDRIGLYVLNELKFIKKF